MAEVLQEYLVSLGMNVDKNALTKFNDTLKDLSRVIESATKGWTKAFVQASTAIAGALATVNAATAGLMERMAKLDMEQKKFALHMYMNVDAAKKMKIATDALGESLEDIAWIPELRGRYKNLIGLQNQLAPPSSYGAEMRHIRDIVFEFTKLKVSLQYGAQWVAHYLFKYLSGPMERFYQWVQKVNHEINFNMPNWTEKVARWLAVFEDLGESAVKFFKGTWDYLKGIWDDLPRAGKLLVVLGAIAALFLSSGPFGKAVMVMSSLLVLVQDYYGYMEGKNAALNWAKIMPDWEKNGKPKIKEFFDKLKEEVEHFFDEGGGFDKLRKWFDFLIEGIPLVFRIIFNSIMGLVDILGHLIHWEWGEAGKRFDKLVKENRPSSDRLNELLPWGNESQSHAEHSQRRANVAFLAKTFDIDSENDSAVRERLERDIQVNPGKYGLGPWKGWIRTAEEQKAVAQAVENYMSGGVAVPGASVIKAVPGVPSTGRNYLKEGWNWFTGAAESFFSPSSAGASVGPSGSYGGGADALALVGDHESRGRYGAVNPDSGAYGKYQIMPGNWPSWAEEAGLGRGAKPTPENQEIVARHKWSLYLKEFNGDTRLAAIAWYAGPKYSRAIMQGKRLPYSPYKRHGGGKYPSLAGYLRESFGMSWRDLERDYGGSSSFGGRFAANYNRMRRTADSYGHRQQSSSNVNASVGDTHVTVNVNNPNASAAEIAEQVAQRVENERDMAMARVLRMVQPVYQ